MQTAHDQVVVSSNPGTVYWMDISTMLQNLPKKIIKDKLKIKVAKWGTPKKKYFKNSRNFKNI